MIKDYNYYGNNDAEDIRDYGKNNKDNRASQNYYKSKTHNHEFEGSTDYAEDDECVIHNHRFAGVTGPAIYIPGCKSHVHKIETSTDTFDDHAHKICDTTGPALYIPGGNGKHIHLVKGTTRPADGHDHDYYFTTLVEDPTNVPKDKKC